MAFASYPPSGRPGAQGPQGLAYSTLLHGGEMVPLTGHFLDVCDILDIEPDSSGVGVGTDHAAAINGLIQDSDPAHMVGFYFRSGAPGFGYRMSTALRPKRTCHLKGHGNWGVGYGPTFFVDALSGPGLIIDGPSTAGAGNSATGSIIEGLAFQTQNANTRANSTAYTVGNTVKLAKSNGFYYECTVAGTSAGSVNSADWPTTVDVTFVDGTVTWKCKAQIHGIEYWAPALLRNVAVRRFAGHGVRIYGHNSAGGLVPFTNANSWRMEHVTATENIGFGYHVQGGDANAGEAFKCDAFSNLQGGIKDMSDLGNAWICPTMEFNGDSATLEDAVAYQAQVDFQVAVSHSILMFPYIEGGAPMKSNGNLVLFGECLFGNSGWQSGQPTSYGSTATPSITVRNLTRGAPYAWDVLINGGSSGGAIPLQVSNVNGDSEAWQFRQSITETLLESLWAFYHSGTGELIAGFPSQRRNQTMRWIMNQSQLGTDNQTSCVREFSEPAYLTNGERIPKGSIYRLSSTFAAAGPAYKVAGQEGMAYARWTVNTAYTAGNVVVDSNGKLQRCTTAGTSHATTEPTWSGTFGNTTADNGTLVWTAGLNVPDFAASTDYSRGDIFKPNPRDGFTYKVDAAANSGAGTPSFSGLFGERLTHNSLFYRRWGYDFTGVRWCNGPNTGSLL